MATYYVRLFWPAPFNRVQIRSDNPVNWTQFEGGHSMPRGKKYRAEEIIPKLREAEILISQGSTQELAAKNIGVSVQTLIRWRKEYGGLRIDQAKRLKAVEKENGRLKKLLAESEPDKAILKEAVSGNF